MKTNDPRHRRAGSSAGTESQPSSATSTSTARDRGGPWRIDAPKVLRVGIVEGDRLIEERILPNDRIATVGSSRRATLVLPGCGFIGPLPLFVARRGGYQLVLRDGISGALALDGSAVTPLDTVRASIDRQADGTWSVPLEPQARGKVVLGRCTLLFQFVPPPPAPAARAIRSGGRSWMRQLDSTFMRVLALSAVLHGVAMVQLMAQPRPPEPTLELMPLESVVVFVPKKKPEPVEKPTTAKPARQDERIALRPPPPARRPEPDRLPDAPEDEEAKKRRFQQMIVSRFGGERGWQVPSRPTVDEGTWKDLLKQGPPAIQPSGSGENGGLRGPAGGGEVEVTAPIGPIDRRENVQVALKKKVPPPVLEPVTTEGDARSRDGIEKLLSQKSGAITRCYERALNLNPTLQGKYYLEFVIERGGQVIQFEVTSKHGQVDEEFSTCLAMVSKRWQFPESDQDVEVRLPVVLTPQD